MPYFIPWYVAILVSIPETILFLLLGFKLFNLELSKQHLLYLSLLNAGVAYIVRNLPIFYGIHTLIMIVLLALVGAALSKIKFKSTFIAVLTGGLLLGIIQGMTIPLIFNFTGLNMADSAQNPWLNILFFIPSGFIMLAIYWYIKKYNFVLYNLKS